MILVAKKSESQVGRITVAIFYKKETARKSSVQFLNCQLKRNIGRYKSREFKVLLCGDDSESQ